MRSPEKNNGFPAEAGERRARSKKQRVSGRGGKTLRSLEKTKGFQQRREDVALARKTSKGENQKWQNP